MIGAVLTVVGIKVVLFRESEDTETSLVKAGSVAVEYVVVLKYSVIEDNIGTEVVDGTSAVVTNGFVVEHDVEEEEQLEVESMGAIETALLVVGDECPQ